LFIEAINKCQNAKDVLSYCAPMRNDNDMVHRDLQSLHRRELESLRSQLVELAQRVDQELIGLDAKIEKRLEDSEMRVAHQAVDMAVKQAFAYMGVDVNDPQQVQAFRDDVTFGGLLKDAAKKSFYAMLAAIGGVVGMSIVIAIKGFFGWK
jgi:hypothetical protein